MSDKRLQLIFCMGFMIGMGFAISFKYTYSVPKIQPSSMIFVQESDANYRRGNKSDGFVQVPIASIVKGLPIEVPQDDPALVKFILDKYLIKPSTEPYNLDKPHGDPSMGQGQLVRKLLRHQKRGYFVEASALDGETRSNTLYLEKELDWEGLLIEGDPKNYGLLLKKNRKAWSSKSCLATKPYPHQVIFQRKFSMEKIQNHTIIDAYMKMKRRNGAKVQCFSLYSLLSALGRRTVDYFSLGVEGKEMEVLENIPFDKLFIKIISVEFTNLKESKKQMKIFLKSKGFVFLQEITEEFGLANGLIFVHKSILPSLHVKGNENY